MADLTLDHVTKVFTEDDGNQIVAVDDVNVEIEDGEFLVLVGPSGCGKSTTLRMIAGLETITGGTISLGDRVLNDLPAKDRDIAMVFQSYALYPHMSVRQNMRFGLEESTDMAGTDMDRIVEDTAEMMGIGDLLDRKPSELSGGQQQRVALGRAIVRDPQVFLMDEPLSNLDAKLRATMRTELQRLQEDLDVTTVYVTHDQTEAMTMGDRIAVLDDGILQQVGTPLECYHQPNNEFVAGFIGEPSMNFFEMEVQGTRLIGEEFAYPISDELANDLKGASGATVTFGIRPEDIEFAPEQSGGPHEYEATVDVVEPMGDENIVYLTFDESGDSGTVGEDEFTFVATIDGMRSVEAGQPVNIVIPEDAIHVFDAGTGEALHNRDLETVDAMNPRL